MTRLNPSLRWLLPVALCPALALAASHDDFNGVWHIDTPVVHLQTTAGALPPLLPAARALYAQRSALQGRGDRSFDSTLRCKPMGEPRTAYDADGGPFEILVNPQVVAFGYTWNRMIRFVYLNQAKPEAVGPSYYGSGDGHWDHDTLVIHVHDLQPGTLLDAAGMPHSNQLQLVERYRLLPGGSKLEETLRFEDAQTFSRPWETRLTYTRMPGAHIQEDVCIERLKITDY